MLSLIDPCMNTLNFRIEHIGLAATKPEDLRSWYVEVMGAIELWTDGQFPPAFLVRLPAGEILEIYPSTSSLAETSDNKLGGWRHLALRVNSIEESKKVLEASGVIFDQPIRQAGGKGRVLFFQDPEGNLLHLVERPPEWSLTGSPLSRGTLT